MKKLQFLQSDFKHYGIAVAAVLAALALQGLLTRLLGDHNPYHTLWAALILSAWYCGVGPSVLAFTIGLLGVWYWFVPPPNSFAIQEQSEVYGMLVFVFLSACIIAVGESYRRGTARRLEVERDLRIAQAELEDRVQERTAELNAANASLRELPGRLLKMQDEGRRRIARELHDGIGQYLASLKFQIHQIERLTKENSTPSKALLSETCGTVDHCISEVRTISHLLHPPLLDELGLVSAIRWYVEGFSKRSGVTVSMELPEGSSRFPASVELALFRVLQESLTNVHRHSGCSAVTVRLEANEKELNLRVKDNGRGIPEDRIRRFREHGTGFGVGIVGMQERLREIGGQLKINSDASGTTLVATVPLNLAASEGNSPAEIGKSVSAGH